MTIPEQKTQMSFARLLTPKNLGKFTKFHWQICPAIFDIFMFVFAGNIEI